MFDAAPSMTLTAGAAAVHQSIVGDRLRLALDGELAAAVTGAAGPVGPSGPGLRCGDRPDDAGDPAGEGQSVLPRAGLPPLSGDRRYVVHPHRGGWAEAELNQAGSRADGACGLADDHRRRRRPTDPRLPPLRDAAAAAKVRPTPVTPMICRRSAPNTHRSPTRPRTGTPTPTAPRSRERISMQGLAGAVLHSSADIVSGAPELARLDLEYRCYAP